MSTTTSKTAEMLQGFKESERLPAPPIPVDLQTALDDARTKHKAAMAEHVKLITERETLPLLIGKAADAGNTVLARQLKQRRTDIEFDIMQAEVEAIEAEITAERAKEAVFSARAKAARKVLDEATTALELAHRQFKAAQEAHASVFARSVGSRAAQLKRKLESVKAHNAHKLSGSGEPRMTDGWDYASGFGQVAPPVVTGATMPPEPNKTQVRV